MWLGVQRLYVCDGMTATRSGTYQVRRHNDNLKCGVSSVRRRTVGTAQGGTCQARRLLEVGHVKRWLGLLKVGRVKCQARQRCANS